MVSRIIYSLRENTESVTVQEQPELIVNVRARRQALGLTQQQLAERAGISRQTLVAIEAGRLTPSVTVALRLARALGCTVDDLFALAEPPLLEAAGAGRTVVRTGSLARAPRPGRRDDRRLAGSRRGR